ncbi:MAG: hypothetical protein JWM57_2640 [Phycisphaerales bacterium]|nr:hypothetical protein [Phycisphaerales bacterium]
MIRRKRLRRIGLLGAGIMTAGLLSGAESPRRGMIQPHPTIQLTAGPSARTTATVSIGSNNGTELLGSAIAGVLCLRSARRRQWI